MSTTINRRPYSVDLPNKNSVKNYFFNQNKFNGLIEDKNFLETDPTSFSDCKNVYVDPDGVFKSRPSLDLYQNFLGNGINQNDDLVDIYNFKISDFNFDKQTGTSLSSNVTEIWILVIKGTNKYLTNIVSDGSLSFVNTKDFVNKPIIVKTNNKIYAIGEGGNLDATPPTFTGSVAELELRLYNGQSIFGWKPAPIYIPITEIIKGTARIPAESSNVLTGSYRTRYLFDTINSTQYDDFVGKSVDVTISGITKSIDWTAGQEKGLLRKIGSVNNYISASDWEELTGEYKIHVGLFECNGVYVKYSIEKHYNYIDGWKWQWRTGVGISTLAKCYIPAHIITISFSFDGINYSNDFAFSNCVTLPKVDINKNIYVVTGNLSLSSNDVSDENLDLSLELKKLDTTSLNITNISVGTRSFNYTNDCYPTVNEYPDNIVWWPFGKRLFGFDIIDEDRYAIFCPWCIMEYYSDDPNDPEFAISEYAFVKINSQSSQILVEKDYSSIKTLSDATSVYMNAEMPIVNVFLNSFSNEIYFVSSINYLMTSNTKRVLTLYSNSGNTFNAYYINYEYVKTLSNLSNILYYISESFSTDLYIIFLLDNEISISDFNNHTYEILDASINTNDLVVKKYTNVQTISIELYTSDKIGILDVANKNALFDINIIEPIDTILSVDSNFLAAKFTETDIVPIDIYANSFDQYNLIVIDTTTEGELTKFNPDHYSYLSEHYFSEGNTLYISSTGLQPTEYEIEDIKGNIEHNSFEWYLPKMFTNEFDNDITYLHPISATEMAVFFEKEIYYVTFDTQNSVYRAFKTMHQVGLVEGGEVITTFDTKYVIFSSQRGLVAMSYQEFMATTEQSLNFLSDTIHDLYKVFNMTPVKLYKYDYWIVAYHENFNGAMLFDLRNNSWWPWEIPYDVTKIITYLKQDDEKGDKTIPMILAEGSLYEFNRSEIDYNDEGNIIDWFFTSQRLPFALNYYKHIINLTFVSLYDVEKLRENGWSDYRIGLKLTTMIYRTNVTNGELAPQPIYYPIDFVRTYVQRLNYSKVEEFQYQINSDNTNAHPLPLSLVNLTVKYKVGSQVR